MTPFSILPRNLLSSFDNAISSDENVAVSVTRLRLVLHLLWTRFTKFLLIHVKKHLLAVSLSMKFQLQSGVGQGDPLFYPQQQILLHWPQYPSGHF